MKELEIQLNDKELQLLHTLAREKGLSKSEVIRRALEHWSRTENGSIFDEKWNKATEVIGQFSSGKPRPSVARDRFLVNNSG